MSKLTKMVNNPELFLKDMIKKKVPSKLKLLLNKKLNNKTKPIPQNSSTTVLTKPSVAVKPAPKNQLNISNVNFSRNIPFVIHCGESLEAGSNQLLPWIPIFTQANKDFLVIVRNEPIYKWMKSKFPWVYTAYAKSASDIESIIKLLPSLKYVFYPSSTGNNIHLVRFNHLNHVFIGHGDSDKQSSAHKALRIYDEIWTAGQAHIDRFKNMNFDTAHLKFLKVGRPNLSNILKHSETKFPFHKVLYLPTWEGVIEDTNYSSTHHSGSILQEVFFKFNIDIDVKYHPFTGNRNKALQNINNNTQNMIIEDALSSVIISKDINISNILQNYNIFICDISGVITECLAANCPIFVYVPADRKIIIAESDMTYSDYCYTYSSLAELLEKLEIVLGGNDYLAEQRNKAINYFLGYEETLEDKLINQLKAIAENNQPKFISRLFEEL